MVYSAARNTIATRTAIPITARKSFGVATILTTVATGVTTHRGKTSAPHLLKPSEPLATGEETK